MDYNFNRLETTETKMEDDYSKKPIIEMERYSYNYQNKNTSRLSNLTLLDQHCS